MSDTELEDEIIVEEIADAVPKKTSVPSVPREKAAATPKIDGARTDDALAAIRAKYARERELRLQAKAELDTALKERDEAQYVSIQASEESLRTKEADLRARIAAARREGDYDAESKLDDELFDVKASIRDLSRGRERLESTREEAAARPKPTVEADDPDAMDDDVRFEQAVSRFTARTGAWLRQHPEFVTDPKAQAKVTSAHYAAVADDLKPDTDEYFEYIESRLGLRQEDAGDDTDDDAGDTIIDEPKPKPVARPNVSAPTDDRRSPRKSGDLGNGRYRLTPQEAAFCRDSGTDPRAYALAKVQMKKEGRLG